jgi:hypothetical protein
VASSTPVVEEPVLSHAERRRQKKEAKLAAKLQESAKEEKAAVKKRKLKDGTAKNVGDLTNKRQNSVWVGNMSFKTTVENLRAFFKECGEITRINMPTKAPTGPGVKPENRGCVVNFFMVYFIFLSFIDVDLLMSILRHQKRRRPQSLCLNNPLWVENYLSKMVC